MKEIKAVLDHLNKEVLICEKLGITTKGTLLALAKALTLAIKAA